MLLTQTPKTDPLKQAFLDGLITEEELLELEGLPALSPEEQKLIDLFAGLMVDKTFDEMKGKKT